MESARTSGHNSIIISCAREGSERVDEDIRLGLICDCNELLVILPIIVLL